MAEVNEEQEGQESQSDFDKVQGFIRDQVKSFLDQELQNRVRPTPQPQVDEQQQRNSMIADVIAPVVGPHINRALINSADAKDQVKFYRKNPDAAEYEEQIETLWEDLAKQGRIVARDDIYHFIIGREANQDFDKLSQKREARKKAQLERAEGAGDFGASGLARGKDDPKWAAFHKADDFDKLAPDEQDALLKEMEQALSGVTF